MSSRLRTCEKCADRRENTNQLDRSRCCEAQHGARLIVRSRTGSDKLEPSRRAREAKALSPTDRVTIRGTRARSVHDRSRRAFKRRHSTVRRCARRRACRGRAMTLVPPREDERAPSSAGPLDDAALAQALLRKTRESAVTQEAFFAENAASIVRCSRALAAAFQGGARLFVFGNGGSACDAEHLAVELTYPVVEKRKPLRRDGRDLRSPVRRPQLQHPSHSRGARRVAARAVGSPAAGDGRRGRAVRARPAGRAACAAPSRGYEEGHR